MRYDLVYVDNLLSSVRRLPRRFRNLVRRFAPMHYYSYEELYETHGNEVSPGESIGDGDFDLIGRIQTGLLKMEGLRDADTVVDFGCGTGRLAVHLVPALGASGHYIGIDIAESMLRHARALVGHKAAVAQSTISWIKQTSATFPLPDDSVDLMCAFSVFTHMEHEDSYRYLTDAKRITRPGGKFLFSCLPMNLKVAREIFLAAARLSPRARWNKVRNVTTTTEMMTTIAQLAGWEVVRWYAGDAENVTVEGETKKWGLGQSTCVLMRPS